MERIILHIDLNAFFAAVEQQVNPHLRGKPVLVGARPGGRGVVCTASYEAREYGVKTGMSIREAQQLCPKGIYLAVDPGKYMYTSQELFWMFREYTPLVEIFSVDEAFLDVTETHSRFCGVESLVKRIKGRIRNRFGLSCSVGIGPNKLIAKLASNLEKPDGLVWIRREEIPSLFERLPVTALCGIGDKMANHLAKLGIETCGDLGRTSEDLLTGKFGIIGWQLREMGRGNASNKVLPYHHEEEVKSMGHSVTLPRDIRERKDIDRVILQLSEQVGRRLRKGSYQGRTVALTLRYTNFDTFSRHRTFQRHMDDGYIIYQAGVEILKTLRIQMAIRLVGISVSQLIESDQLPLFPEERKRMNLQQAMDQINDRYGEFTLSRASLLTRVAFPGVVPPSWRPHRSSLDARP
jgi:DNA polymerase-4